MGGAIKNVFPISSGIVSGLNYGENAGAALLTRAISEMVRISIGLGGNKDIIVDVRVIAATNKNLLEEIKAGNFREDLFHRLAVILIEVPPLNERKEDIDILVKHFVNLLSSDQGLEINTFDSKAIDTLKNYPWSGNIRELRNVIERLLILGDDPITKENIIQFAQK